MEKAFALCSTQAVIANSNGNGLDNESILIVGVSGCVQVFGHKSLRAIRDAVNFALANQRDESAVSDGVDEVRDKAAANIAISSGLNSGRDE